jgi:hypothetical protein
MVRRPKAVSNHEATVWASSLVGFATEIGMNDPIRLVANLSDASVLLIENDKYDTGGVFLYHHENSGSVWDTWHPTIDEAKEQATFGFGLAPEAWLEVPTSIGDPIRFARGIEISN